jgi:CHAT domain-containing protein/uncharacterized protein HemY
MVKPRFPSMRLAGSLLLVFAGSVALPSLLIAQAPPAPEESKAAMANTKLPAEVQAQLNKLEAALKAAQAAGDQKAAATALNQTGELYFRAAEYRTALDSYNQALTAARTANDAQQQATAFNGMGNCYRMQNENQKALDTYQQELDLAASSADERGQAAALIGIGWVNGNMGQTQKALDFHNRALTLARKVGDSDMEAITLRRLGVDSALLGQMQQALDYLGQALTEDREAGDRVEEGLTLNATGLLYGNLGQKEKALEYFNQALPILRQAGHPVGEAAALSDIGLADAALGHYEKALDYYNQALVIDRRIGDRAGQADVLSGIGAVYAVLNNPQKALDLFDQVLPIYRETGDPQREANTLKQIGLAYDAKGDKQKALDFYNQALPVFRQAGDLEGEAKTLGSIGDRYYDLGDKQKAIDFYGQASTVYGQQGDLKDEAYALYGMGNVWDELGDRAKALDYFNRALLVYRQAGDRAGEASALIQIGIVHYALRNEQQALDNQSQALLIYRQTGDHVGEAATLNNIGNVYFDLGEWDRALDLYTQALDTFRQIGNLDGEAGALNDIGIAYEDLGDDRKALDSFNQALPMLRQLGDQADEANTLGNMGVAYSELGDNARALDYFNQALPVLQQLGDRTREANTLANIGIVYARLGEREKALDYYGRALPGAAAVSDPFLEANINLNLMRVERPAQPALAIFFGKQAVNFLQQVRGNMKGLDKQLQSRFLDSRSNYYHELADLLIDQGRLPEAQQVLDFMKQQEYSDYVRGGPIDTLDPLALTPAEQQAQQDYQKSTAQLVSVGEEWAELKKVATRTPQQETRYQQLSAQLDNASKDLNDYYARLYVLFGKNSEANKQVADVKGDVSALEDQIAETPHTVALYTMVTADHYRVIVITSAATVAREFAISDKELNKKVADFEEALRDPSRDPRPLGQDLYRILIGPVKAELEQAGAVTLVWSLDGVLRYVPIAALYDGKRYVVEKYNTVTITPASIAHLSETPDVNNLSAVAMGISKKYEEGLMALPAVVGELDDVVKDAQVPGANGVIPGTILLDGQFTEAAMEKLLDSRPGVVHIASHFVFKPGDDSQSYLLLAGKDAGGTGFHLTVANFRDNKNLALRHTDLLTLSACETGMSGSASNGREVDGLGATAQLKGAKAVISSLWAVNDASTGTLMGDFYKRWADGAGKVTKVEALRQAQLDLLLGRVKPHAGDSGRGFGSTRNEQDVPKGYAHPYYWAPFVLMGNWR